MAFIIVSKNTLSSLAGKNSHHEMVTLLLSTGVLTSITPSYAL